MTYSEVIEQEAALNRRLAEIEDQIAYETALRARSLARIDKLSVEHRNLVDDLGKLEF